MCPQGCSVWWGDTGDKASHGAMGPTACRVVPPSSVSPSPPRRLPLLWAPVAAESVPVHPPVPSQRAGGSPVAMGFGVPCSPAPRGRASSCPCPQAVEGPGWGNWYSPALWLQCVPPSWGHGCQSDQVREGPGDNFSLSLAPRCHHRYPKIARSSCSASSCQHCLQAGPPCLLSRGGQAPDPAGWVSPRPSWDTAQGTAPQGKTGDLFPGQGPGQSEPQFTHPPNPGGDEKGRGCPLSPHPGCRCPKSAQSWFPHVLPASPQDNRTIRCGCSHV